MHTFRLINNISAHSDLGLFVLFPSTHARPVERVIQGLHAIAEPFCAFIDTAISLCANILAALIAQFELFFDK